MATNRLGNAGTDREVLIDNITHWLRELPDDARVIADMRRGYDRKEGDGGVMMNESNGTATLTITVNGGSEVRDVPRDYLAELQASDRLLSPG